jgi:hypothetical protein
VLGDRRQPLVQDEAEVAVVRANHIAAPPEVRVPMPHRLDLPNELALIGC